jgi:caffeoyl-CoA O-methyltransferase
MEERFEKYITDHSTPEDPLLEELFRQTHLRFVNPNMSVGFIQGKLLEFISGMIKPHKILEIGTFTGYSTICLAKGIEPAGKLITIEINDELKVFAQSYFKRAGLESVIVQLTGRAQDIVPGLDHLFDLAYIDGDKREYIDYFSTIMPKMRPGGYIIADNVLWGEKILDKTTKDPQTRGIIEFNEMIKEQKNIKKIILPVRDGLMLIRIIS